MKDVRKGINSLRLERRGPNIFFPLLSAVNGFFVYQQKPSYLSLYVFLLKKKKRKAAIKIHNHTNILTMSIKITAKCLHKPFLNYPCAIIFVVLSYRIF